MELTPQSQYQVWLDNGRIQPDAGQQEVVRVLQRMYDIVTAPNFLHKGSVLKTLLTRRKALPNCCGAYIWGGVGRGKSMLMDMFYELVPFEKKRRVHFHAFMRDVHSRMHAWRQLRDYDDLIPNIVDEISSECQLLCLDEFQVHDVTDAMILSRLFRALFQAGVIIVTTSNRPPNELYQGGLQREQFEKFIELTERRMLVTELTSDIDYRLKQLKAMKQVYYTPIDEQALDFLYDSYSALTQNATSTPLTIEISGRKIVIEKNACGIAWMTFEELCERPLGASDYIEIATEFHTLLLQDIPALSPERRNEAKRFVTLIDALYEHKVKLICTAAVPAEELYPKGDGSFEFERTVSRLQEMQSESYLGASHLA